MYVHHMHAWFLLRPGEYAGSQEVDVQRATTQVSGTDVGVLHKGSSALSHLSSPTTEF